MACVLWPVQVQQYHEAVQAIIQGRPDAATPLLLQLLDEPLLQPPAAAGSPSTAQRKQQPQQQAVAVQSRVLQGMRPKVLLSLAPLLGPSLKALDIWAEALSYDQHNPKVWEEVSIVLAHLGHLRLAVQAAERALCLRPMDVALHERLAVLLAALEVSKQRRLLTWCVRWLCCVRSADRHAAVVVLLRQCTVRSMPQHPVNFCCCRQLQWPACKPSCMCSS